jgi:hypothetical protein
VPYHNIVLGVPAIVATWDKFIEEQIAYFRAHNVPFVWLVDEDVRDEFNLETAPTAVSRFKQKLITHGLKENGIIKGVSGSLNSRAAPTTDLCQIEAVQDRASLAEFSNLVCDTRAIQGQARADYEQAMWHECSQSPPKMHHYVARKEGKVVSAISTFVDGNIISIWNLATEPVYRKQGLSTALCCYALHARPTGCTLAASYLTPSAMALGICQKLGFTTTCHFHAFVHQGVGDKPG